MLKNHDYTCRWIAAVLYQAFLAQVWQCHASAGGVDQLHKLPAATQLLENVSPAHKLSIDVHLQGMEDALYEVEPSPLTIFTIVDNRTSLYKNNRGCTTQVTTPGGLLAIERRPLLSL